MIIEQKLKAAWKKGIKRHGITLLAKEAAVDCRTIIRAIEGGKCHKDSYDRINVALLKLNKELKKDDVVSQLLAEQ